MRDKINHKFYRINQNACRTNKICDNFTCNIFKSIRGVIPILNKIMQIIIFKMMRIIIIRIIQMWFMQNIGVDIKFI